LDTPAGAAEAAEAAAMNAGYASAEAMEAAQAADAIAGNAESVGQGVKDAVGAAAKCTRGQDAKLNLLRKIFEKIGEKIDNFK
jgi:hypothetical protein